MGTFLTYRIAGGEGGMRHFMAQFGPALQWPWTKLTDVPELTDAFLDTHRRAVGRAGRRPLRARARAAARRQPRRDPAGAAHRRTTRAGAACCARTSRGCSMRSAASAGEAVDDVGSPCACIETRRPPRLGRLQRPHDREPLPAVLRRRDRRVPAPRRHRRRATSPAGTAASRSRRTSLHHAEARADEPLSVETQVLGADAKRLHLFHTVCAGGRRRGARDRRALLLHVDTEAGARVVPHARAARGPRRRRSRARTRPCPGPRAPGAASAQARA